MNRSLTISVLLAFSATACVEGDELAGAQLWVDDDVVLQWDVSFNGQSDGLGAVVPVDVMVFDSITGEPVFDVALLVESGHNGTQIIDVDRVLGVEPEDCLNCDMLWDAWSDRYVAFDQVLAPEDTMVVHTDEDGQARIYLVVDNFSVDGVADFEAVPVLVSMGIKEATFHIVPQ